MGRRIMSCVKEADDPGLRRGRLRKRNQVTNALDMLEFEYLPRIKLLLLTLIPLFNRTQITNHA